MYTSIWLALVRCWTNWTRLIHDWLIWNRLIWNRMVSYLEPCKWGRLARFSISSHGIGGHRVSAWLGHGIRRLVWRWVAWARHVEDRSEIFRANLSLSAQRSLCGRRQCGEVCDLSSWEAGLIAYSSNTLWTTHSPQSTSCCSDCSEV